jgi:hypothetical protein
MCEESRRDDMVKGPKEARTIRSGKYLLLYAKAETPEQISTGPPEARQYVSEN